ncbi:TPA: hypothetical protein ACN34U_002707 [Vibrio parahaemolyticus]
MFNGTIIGHELFKKFNKQSLIERFVVDFVTRFLILNLQAVRYLPYFFYGK